MSNPLVTCLCLTRNRREWLPKAIACFERQTYQERELVIIADGEDPVTDLVPKDARIRLMVIGWTSLVVGKKRNIGCQYAQGEIIAHWDDDDYSAPHRLAHQVGRLSATGKWVTGYHSMKFTDGMRWWQYRGSAGFVLGTSLCYRRAFWTQHPFAQIQCGQDEAFGATAVRQGTLAAEKDLNLMYATNHAGNTSPRPTGAVSASWSLLEDFQWTDGAVSAEVAA